MSRRAAIQAALSAWRYADWRLAKASDGDRDALAREVERHRAEFQRLSSEHAARHNADAGSRIWDTAGALDEETPRRRRLDV
jgi:hypothetical protein